MKKPLLTLFITSLFALTANAQSYIGYMTQGKSFYKKQQYLTALERFDLAFEFAQNDSEKDQARNWKNKSRVKIKQQQQDLQAAIRKSNQILKALLPQGVTNIYAYFATKADKNFASGEYGEAYKNYNLAKNAPDIPPKTNILTKFNNAKNCFDWQSKALKYLQGGQYNLAEKEILKVLKTNPTAKKTILIASALNPLYGMTLVQGGEFMMGSEEYDNEQPVHKVTLNTFEIAKYEVTNLQFATFLNKYGSSIVLEGKYKGKNMIKASDWGVSDNRGATKWEAQKGYEYHPVVSVTWYGANMFCEFHGLKLPSEAQWEYAARGGIAPRHDVVQHKMELQYPGNNNIDSIAWCYKTTKGTCTFPVGLLKANQLGVYDLSGNVWEWCSDNWHSDYTDAPNNGTAWIDDNNKKRVKRGGSWNSSVWNCSASYRNYNLPLGYSYDLGFRPMFCP